MTDREEKFLDEGPDECDACGTLLEWSITHYGKVATCWNCGKTYEIEPSQDEDEQIIRY